ncbi:MAG: phosphatidylserine/phosphatidylglycerophosphate/cardiolipin synthase family protein [Sandaracinaceae bacterium]
MRSSSIHLALLALLALGCGGETTPTDGGSGGDDAAIPEDDAGSMPDAGPTDAGNTPDAGTDAGPDPVLPPSDIDACATLAALAFVDDASTSTELLMSSGVDAALAATLTAGRPYGDLETLARAPGMTDAAWRALAAASADGCALDDGEPAIEVRFTSPQCAAMGDVPAGVRCEGTSAERNASREAAGIVDHLVRWIDATRRVKEAHPERAVRIVMAYLVWSDYRVFDALCRASAAGVRIEGFFDAGITDTQPDELMTDAACTPANIDIHFLGGVTEPVEDWRLMHIKMMLFDTGEPTTRLVFGSANLTATGSTLHFENWAFARFPSDSHFVASHACARDALYADRDIGAGYPDAFESTYDTCVAGLSATPDPDFAVWFTPDADEAALNALVSEVEGASASVDLAVQHFSNYTLGTAIRASGRDSAIATRVLLDDDTWYDVGEVGGSDRALYDALFDGEPLDIRFLQTNYYFEFGWQFQHNKFVTVDDDAVFCGAGNFTEVAFRDNYENFYLLRDPEVVAQFTAEYDRLWALSKASSGLPADPEF